MCCVCVLSTTCVCRLCVVCVCGVLCGVCAVAVDVADDSRAIDGCCNAIAIERDRQPQPGANRRSRAAVRGGTPRQHIRDLVAHATRRQASRLTRLPTSAQEPAKYNVERMNHFIISKQCCNRCTQYLGTTPTHGTQMLRRQRKRELKLKN